MASRTAADVLIDALEDWGVSVIFGLPGDGINGIMESLRQRQDRVRFVQVRHEESAAFMACAYAKYTGKLGVCLSTSGPGAVHLLNGLYDAKMDGASVLAITGMPYHDLIGTHTQQDVATDRLFSDVAALSERIMGPAHVETLTDMACRTALDYHTVAHIAFPVDLQSADMGRDKRSKRNIAGHSSDAPVDQGVIPADIDLKLAATVLNEGKRVAILAGRGALNASDELEQTAAVLGAPVIKALLGKAALADDSAYTTGGIGLLGTKPSQEAIESCDTLLIVGSSFPYIEFYPKPGQARCVQIELDPMRIGLRYPTDVGLVGDASRTLRALQPLLQKQTDRSFLQKAQEGMQDWRQLLFTQATVEGKPMKPQTVVYQLDQRLADNAIVSLDSGTVTQWGARFVNVKGSQMLSVSGTLASMGCAVPYAIAAQIAHPERQCVALCGDGGFTMTMGELATAVKYKLPLKIVILNNSSLGMIKWEQMVFLGNPEYGCELQRIDFAAIARACGAEGYSVDDPKDLPGVLDDAFAHDGPVVIDAIVDPYEPPMPPKVTREQAVHFAQALLKGEPNREQIVLTVISDKVREMV
jgi:pyruvate dehydrogenase (quinone)/pyruvate oxidase